MAKPSERKRPGSTETHHATVAPDEALKRTLERDTAVQGEREEEAVQRSRSPAGSDPVPPAPSGGRTPSRNPK